MWEHNHYWDNPWVCSLDASLDNPLVRSRAPESEWVRSLDASLDNPSVRSMDAWKGNRSMARY